MIDLNELLARAAPPTQEEEAELMSDAMIGQAILLAHMNTTQESRLLAIGTMMAMQDMSPEERKLFMEHHEALASICKNVAYLVAGITISQEWR